MTHLVHILLLSTIIPRIIYIQRVSKMVLTCSCSYKALQNTVYKKRGSIQSVVLFYEYKSNELKL